MLETLQEKPAALGEPGGPVGGDREPGGERDRPPDGVGGDPARFGLWVFLGTLTMLFIGFTSAYMVRRASDDWGELAPPPVLWLNTAVLLLSSFSLQTARRRLRGWDLSSATAWLGGTGALGGLFVVGQVAAWRMLAARGLYLATDPHSSFFYVLTGIHALHLVGGLGWFTAVLLRFRRMAVTPGEDGLRLFATYWHFLGGLWLYLLWLLFVY